MLLQQLGRVISRMGHVVQVRNARAVFECMFEHIEMTNEVAI